jgi:hypothetical protein
VVFAPISLEKRPFFGERRPTVVHRLLDWSETMHDRKKLGEILVDLGVLTQAQVEQILWALHRRRDRAKFGRIAREMGLAAEEHILAAVAVQMQMFPGIQNLSLGRLLSWLQEPLPAGTPEQSKRRPPDKPRSGVFAVRK